MTRISSIGLLIERLLPLWTLRYAIREFGYPNKDKV